MSSRPSWFSRLSRSQAFVALTVAYAAALLGGGAVASAVGSDMPMTAVAGGYAASVAVLFGVSQLAGNGSTFDAWWSVAPPAAAWWLVATTDAGGARPVLVACLVTVWGVRLTANWALGWPGPDHEDWRYRQLYQQAPMPRWAVSLTSVHLFPLLAVTLASWPMVLALTRSGREVGWLDGLAAVVVAGAVLLEHVADVQLRRFNRRKQPGEVLGTGLWARSRHPNYLGEIGFWWGLWLFALAADPDTWWTVVGPLGITVMFLAASIPMLERRSSERRPGWADYAAATPMLIPRLRRGSTPPR